jgi:hypothetical protein
MASRLRDLVVKELSLVDRPANPGAKVLLAKREDVRKDMYQVSRFADLIASLAYLMQSAEYEAKNEGDNSPVPGALRTWLKQGAGIFNSMATEEINELLATTATKRKSEETALSKFLGLFKSFGRATSALSESVKSIIDDKSAADKGALLDQTIKQFSEHVEDELEKTLSGEGPGADSEEDDMSPELKKALGLAETASEADAVAAITKRDEDHAQLAADMEILKAALSDDEKSFHNALKSDDDKKAFRGLSRDQRKTRMNKRDDLPPEVKKALDEAEDLKKRLAVLENERELESFKKRAVEIGLTDAQGELLMKAHKGDATSLKKIEDAIKGLHEQIATGKLFTEFGTSQGGEVDAYAEITAKAIDIKKANPKLTIEKAKTMVIEDPANAELMKRYNAEQRAKINKAA